MSKEALRVAIADDGDVIYYIFDVFVLASNNVLPMPFDVTH